MNTNEIWFANWDSTHIRQYIRCAPVYTETSKIQRIEIVDTTPFGRLLILDGQIQNSTRFSAYIHESLYHPALIAHRNPENVLVIGGGDGSGLIELKKYNTIKQIDLVDIDEAVSNVCKLYLPGIADAFNDPRIKTHYLDGVEFIEKNKKKYDVIILDISDPIGPARGIYTRDFYLKIKKALNPNGVIATHCESPESAGDLFYRILATFKSVFNTVIPYRVWIPPYADMWGRVVLSDNINIKNNLKPPQVKKVIHKHNLHFNWLTPDLLDAMFKYFSADIILKMKQEWPLIKSAEDIKFQRSSEKPIVLEKP